MNKKVSSPKWGWLCFYKRYMVGKMLSKLLLIGGGLFMGFIVGLCFLEVSVRMLHLIPEQSDTFTQPHPELGWFHIPNKEGRWSTGTKEFDVQIHINSLGLHDREYTYEKPSGTFRILVLGDSFAEALQVELENSFQEILETKLNSTLDVPFEVLNGGFGGWGTDDELLFYQVEGRKYNPDFVLLAFFPLNDPYDNYSAAPILTDGEVQVVVAPDKRPGIIWTVKTFLARHSRAYIFLGENLPRLLPPVARWLGRVGVMDRPATICATGRRDSISGTICILKGVSARMARGMGSNGAVIDSTQKGS